MGKEKPVNILFMRCGHLTASADKCVRNPIRILIGIGIQSGYMTGQLGGGSLYLAQNLKYLREQKGMTQRELSDTFGLSCAAVGMWEKDHRKPDIETIIHLAEYFGVTLDELVLSDLRPPLPLYASNIRYLRKKHGMTQEDMANLLKYRGKQGYNVIENGKAGLSVENLVKLADFFGVTLDQLVKQDLSDGKEG